MMSGRVRAAASTARNASVVTSTARSGASRNRWYWSVATSSGRVAEQHVGGHLLRVSATPGWVSG